MIDLGTWQHALVKAIQNYQTPETKSPAPANDASVEATGKSKKKTLTPLGPTD